MRREGNVRTIRDIMTPTVVTIHRDKLVCEVEGIFVAYNISGAPLVDDDGNLTGVISKSDVNRFDFTGGDRNYTRAWEIAHPKVIAIEVSASVEEAARRMLDAEVHRLVVTDVETMVGVLSALDFVKLVAEGGDGTT
jgi:predicted transcriptional regulator